VQIENNYSMLELVPSINPAFLDTKMNGMVLGWHREFTISAPSLVNTRGQYELSTQSNYQIESAWLPYNTKWTWFFLSHSLWWCPLFVFVIQHIVCLTVILPNACYMTLFVFS